MAGLLGDVLPWVYSRGNKLRGLLADPLSGAENALADANSRAGGLLAATRAAANEGMSAGPATNALIGLLADAYNPAGMTQQWGRVVTPQEARALVAGKTEKVGGVDPATWIDNTQRDVLQFGRIPLSAVRPNEAGALYDGTVNAARAMDYANRSGDVPPVVLVTGRRGNGLLNVLDGGHRVTAARMRGDEFIPAIVMQRSGK